MKEIHLRVKVQHSLNYLGRDEHLFILQILARDDGGRGQWLHSFHCLHTHKMIIYFLNMKLELYLF